MPLMALTCCSIYDRRAVIPGHAGPASSDVARVGSFDGLEILSALGCVPMSALDPDPAAVLLPLGAACAAADQSQVLQMAPAFSDPLSPGRAAYDIFLL